MPDDRLVIAIDGPSGSGKSTTARAVARRLGLSYLDTGAMYRAVAVAFLDAGVSPDDTAAVIEATTSADIELSLDPDERWVRVNGRDVTAEIREPRTAQNVSAVSTIPECRADMVRRQRALMDSDPRGCVAEGRDITTVVYPDADLRILLTASPEARLRRRAGDMAGKITEDQLRDQVLRRDRDDSTLVDFQTAADGVQLLDTSDMTLAEVVDAITDLAEESRP
ncbi:(d)CMP kinase [Propioniciclava sp. MC1595]|uniref:(d)CMP kinase n=1 Tax=Propioniciclava sp. MC1595 TaxID=2760308 RepID=UPI0016625C7A|nr:(d)CMP kinase [Propioniciclava sp. MC1595]MBB1495902.1 (d)CMP kinase [Propioniciclava sp. MC1595]QTE24618.1 (d)CMP kinase [Propioniciclava sp. MC1595]